MEKNIFLSNFNVIILHIILAITNQLLFYLFNAENVKIQLGYVEIIFLLLEVKTKQLIELGIAFIYLLKKMQKFLEQMLIFF